ANGVAAMTASGMFGDIRVAAGIVGGIDLARFGDSSKAVMLAQMQAGGNRYRGVRASVMYDEVSNVMSHRFNDRPHLLLDKTLRAGFKHLEPLGLLFEAFALEPQLPDVLDLARSFPGTRIIVNHTGGVVGLGRFAGTHQERFPIWRKNIEAL